MSRTAYSAISSSSRVQILHLLNERGKRTISELCEATELHPNTVREHVQRLIDGGYVVGEVEHRTSRGRPRVLYSPAAGRSPVARRKAQEAARRGDLMRRVLPTTQTALPVEAVHQLDALIDDLGDAGFDPLVDEDALTVDLSPCPRADVPDRERATLCGVHLGLMDGVLAQAGGPLKIVGMAASCDPETCVVQLTR